MSALRWTTAGESHGRALVGILEGVPAGLALDVERIDRALARRQRGYGRSSRMQLEQDRIVLQSGTRGGRTLGAPIALLLENRDAHIERLPVPASPRPGHADLAGCHKYGHRDPRAVLERASARETAMRVALAAIAAQLLEHFGIEVFGHLRELGGQAAAPAAIEAAFAGPAAARAELRAASDFHALDPSIEPVWRAAVDAAKERGDSLGGVFEVRALGLTPGLGGYADPRERLTSRIGAALFSIPAVKAVEFGLGFEAARRPGSEAHDAILGAPGGSGPGGGRYRRATNRAGGLEGGMTTGEPLVVRAAHKPIPTLRRGLPSVEFATLEPVEATYQRSDVTAAHAASVVGEAVVALELATAFLAKFGGDSLAQVEQAWRAHAAEMREL